MKYLIFNKETHEYITTYTNKETLKTLDTSKCYYAELKEEKVKPVVEPKKKTNADVGVVTHNQKRSTQSSTSQSHVSYPAYNSTYYDGSSSISCSSDSGSSYSDSNSSCDSSSY